MSTTSTWATITLAIVCTGVTSTVPAFADPECAGAGNSRHCVDWHRLNLNSDQNAKIVQLEDEWSHQYHELKPVLADDQTKLAKMLGDHSSDPVEIMSLQQAIARKREHLNGLATANYLKKRQVLNESQQFNLEQMIRDAVRKRQAAMYPGSSGTDVATDRIQDLMNRVRHIWPEQSGR